MNKYSKTSFFKYFQLRIANCSLSIAYCLLPIVYCLLFLTSCNQRDEHKHIPTNKTSDLDKLVQPTNQTIYSDVRTISPLNQTITTTLFATGEIAYDPRLINTISARFTGRVEKLYVRFNYQEVKKGQRIMDIYSPEILTAQQNLIFLLTNDAEDLALINSSRQQLQLLGLTAGQLKQIETTKKVLDPLPVYSPYGGHVHDMGSNSDNNSTSASMGNAGNSGMGSSSTSSSVQIENLPSSQTSILTLKEGMYVQRGQSIFAVYNTDRVWAVLNIFPKDAALINVGDKVTMTAETSPDQVIEAIINYIEPVIGQNASAMKARVYVKNNEKLNLRIGTLLSAKIIPVEIKGMWLPRKSVIDLGQQKIVFVQTENHFTSQEIKTGMMTDSLIQIISGLTGDEKIAENAQFLVDSESFIITNNNE